MEPNETSASDDDVTEIVALLQYLGKDDQIRKALLPYLRLYAEHKEVVALPFIGRPRNRQRRTEGLCAGIAAMLGCLMPAFAAWVSL